MNRFIAFSVMMLAFAGAPDAAAQEPSPLSSTPVLTQALTDSLFSGTVVTTSVLELAPGARLTNPHRHDAALFGYVLEGAVLTSLENGPIQRYEAGEMFHEPLRILHTHFENPNGETPARVLLVTLAKPPQ